MFIFYQAPVILQSFPTRASYLQRVLRFSSNYLVLKTILVTMFTFPISPLGCRSSSASRALRGNDGNFIKSSWRKTTR